MAPRREGWLACFNSPHVATGSRFGVIPALKGSDSSGNALAEEGETGRLGVKNSLSYGEVDCTWCDFVL